MTMPDRIVVLDFGSQYNELIARRIREFGVYSELLPGNTALKDILERGDVKGIIFSGGPNSVYEDGAPLCDPALFTSGIPLLGICYGMQMTHYMLGGTVEGGAHREYGRTVIRTEPGVLFEGLPEEQTVWMSHGDQVTVPAPGFRSIAHSDTCTYAASADDERKIYTLQFHPEVRNTEYGLDILRRFVFNIAGALPAYSMHGFIDEQCARIREQVGQDKVLLGLSGGVDSAVAAALLQRAVGDQLYCMFIDHGLLRKNEADSVMDTLSRTMNVRILRIDASDRFLSALQGITAPEEKRKIIGREFITAFTDGIRELLKDEDIHWLAQGTLYTDVIESGTHTAQTIKSHHNVGGLPEDLNFRLIEPLNTLFKDEVRQLGLLLGLPDDIVYRQPFPGPGLGIRIIGEITADKLRMVRESDAILREEIADAGLSREIWQYFTCLTNIRTVGVMGDQRTYDYAVTVRAVDSVDGMTADWSRIPWDVLGRISDRIVNEVRGVNRVLYDITSKPPGTIEYE